MGFLQYTSSVCFGLLYGRIHLGNYLLDIIRCLMFFLEKLSRFLPESNQMDRDHYLWPRFAMIFSRANLGDIDIWRYFLFFATMSAQSIEIDKLRIVKKTTRPQIT